ncbi:SOS response-associated peptidase [Ciceribacter ferrooxidans]|uniref:Abasic site processing protein n=1 Tax=Ciceribacter ferrooxidans TaxID=2509717 RepID=A0A4Q2THQ2_9HYPH|nr:SOS response-associated peptidase [Ciceribacter ferrooxidans]RYC17928.1 SOS response-associated peptidase [Ciceribacter ferrooxidans]
MCGRFSLSVMPEEVRDALGLFELDAFPARYNIAPTQPILVVIQSERREPGSNMPERRAMLVRWGLLPSWVKDPNDFPLLINARAETAIGKASFKAAMRHRRVLVPASGFYEWHRPEKGNDEKSQAYWIRPRNGGVIAFAGLMETWSSPDGSEVDTGAILTVGSNRSIARIHDRMPVVIAPEDYDRWLDCRSYEPREVTDLLAAPADDFFEAVPVSNLVNKVSNTGPAVQAAVAESLPPVEKTDGAAGSGQMSLF